MANKRKFSTFSLAFLDIMSCGFGAVILIFLIIVHHVEDANMTTNAKVLAEVDLLHQEILDGEKNLVTIKNSVQLVSQNLVQTSGLARRVNDEIDAIDNMIKELREKSDDQQILSLKQKVSALTAQKKALEQQQKAGNDARRFVGQGQRQYLTGLKLGGERILILLDTSASMLDSSIVNIIRRRNMPESIKRQSPKWQRAIKAVEWLLAKFPLESQFQLFHFNQNTYPISPENPTHWFNVDQKSDLDNAIEKLYQITPSGGTNLAKAFQSVSALSPMPDNIIIITDSLPTMGASSVSSNTITGPEREVLFEQAVMALPRGIPVNVLLWPMEGDPIAASLFWQLAQVTQGSFMSPSQDWP